MITITLTTGSRTADLLKNRATFPRFRRKNFVGLTVRDATLEIVRAKFRNIPDVKDATEIYYPGELGLFVYENLIAYLKQSKAAPIVKVSERDRYMSKIISKPIATA